MQHLRQQLRDLQQELAASADPQSVRERTEQLRVARQEALGQARTIEFLKETSAAQAAQETAASLVVARAKRRLVEAQRIIENQQATMRLESQQYDDCTG